MAFIILELDQGEAFLVDMEVGSRNSMSTLSSKLKFCRELLACVFRVCTTLI